jgi:quercetin dioxygenase-like cupin family protein
MIKFQKVEDITKSPVSEGVNVQALYSAEQGGINMITMEPGTILDKHIMFVDMWFFVLEGEGIFYLGDDKTVISAESIVECPKDIPRTWKNTGETILRLMAIRNTNPEKPVEFVN